MSKTAITPDGQEHTFPDSTPDAVIDAAIKSYLSEQKKPKESKRGLEPGLALRGPLAMVELLTSLGTGAVSSIPAALAAGTVAPTAGNEAANRVLDNAANAFTFKPRTQLGQQATEKLGSVFDKVNTGLMDVVERPFPFGFGMAGRPGPATVAHTTLTGLPSLLSLKRAPVKLTTKQQVAQSAQEAGYKIPPGSSSDSLVTNILEGSSGRPAIRQRAAQLNVEVHNKLANRALGLAEDAPITRELLETYRLDQGKAYSVIDNVGDVFADATYRRDVSNAISNIKKASSDFSSIAKKEGRVDNLLDIAHDMQRVPTFDSSSARAMIDLLRGEADDAFRSGHAGIGRAYRDLSKAMESNVERRLVAFGEPDVVQAYRNARQNIAKSYSIQEALQGDGLISPASLKAQLKRGVPLTDELLLIAKVNEQFPQSTGLTPTIKEGLKPFSVLDAAVAAGSGAAALANPVLGIPAAFIASRPLVRGGLLSGPGQRLAFPTQSHPFAPGSLAGGSLLDQIINNALNNPENNNQKNK